MYEVILSLLRLRTTIKHLMTGWSLSEESTRTSNILVPVKQWTYPMLYKQQCTYSYIMCMAIVGAHVHISKHVNYVFICVYHRQVCAKSDDCDYYFYIDSTVVLDEPNTLKRLITINK